LDYATVNIDAKYAWDKEINLAVDLKKCYKRAIELFYCQNITRGPLNPLAHRIFRKQQMAEIAEDRTK
jgi:hypothetical protein